MAYDQQLPGCFGERDLILAGHPLDQGRAFSWLISLRNREALWSEVKAQIEEYLRAKGAGSDHIDAQIARASDLFQPWL
jgi:hypothetical protein